MSEINNFINNNQSELVNANSLNSTCTTNNNLDSLAEDIYNIEIEILNLEDIKQRKLIKIDELRSLLVRISNEPNLNKTKKNNNKGNKSNKQTINNINNKYTPINQSINNSNNKSLRKLSDDSNTEKLSKYLSTSTKGCSKFNKEDENTSEGYSIPRANFVNNAFNNYCFNNISNFYNSKTINNNEETLINYFIKESNYDHMGNIISLWEDIIN